MTRTTINWRHVANGAGLVVILVIAGFVAHSTPSIAEKQAPIAVRGELGEPVAGRNILATVDAVRVARSVEASNGWAGGTAGVWVVVDASVEARVDGLDPTLGYARLRVGETTFSASTRPGDGSIAERGMTVGIVWTGPLMFELPLDVVSSPAAANAELQLALDSDPRVDSLLVIPVDLRALDVDESIETDRPVWGAR